MFEAKPHIEMPFYMYVNDVSNGENKIQWKIAMTEMEQKKNVIKIHPIHGYRLFH